MRSAQKGGIPAVGAHTVQHVAAVPLGWRGGMRFVAQRQQVGIRLSRDAVLAQGGPGEGAQDGSVGVQVRTRSSLASQGPQRAGKQDTAPAYMHVAHTIETVQTPHSTSVCMYHQ